MTSETEISKPKEDAPTAGDSPAEEAKEDKTEEAPDTSDVKVEQPAESAVEAVVEDGEKETEAGKRTLDEVEKAVMSEANKKAKVMEEAAPILPSKEGISFFHDNDVLSGRGGGTNVHPGNRNFRDLINLHRRSYLKARKNDKPSISRAIVRSVRDRNGRFLKKDDKSGLWFEVGDDAAREKTSQALRQRAPEMRKLLFDTEREEARAAAEEHLRQQRMMMGMPPDAPVMAGMPGMPPMQMGAFNPALFMAKPGTAPGMPPGAAPPGSDAYQQMFQAAIMGNTAAMNARYQQQQPPTPQQQQPPTPQPQVPQSQPNSESA